MIKNSFSLMLGLVLLLSIAVTDSASAGVVFEIETKFYKNAGLKPEMTEARVEGSNLKMGIAPGSGQKDRGTMIYRGDRGKNGEVIIIDDEDKSYVVMNDSTGKKMSGQMRTANKPMQDMLKNLPKEQRDAIAKAMQKGAVPGPSPMKPPSKPVVKKTRTKGKKAGYPCTKYEVFQDGRKIREIWTTDWSNIKGGAEAEKAFQRLGAFFEAMWKDMPQIHGGNGAPGGQNLYDEMNLINGFPVVVSELDENGGIEEQATLRKTYRRDLGPDDFEPPKGYRLRTMGPQ